MAGATKRAALAVGLTAAGCLMMAWVEGVPRPVYPVKSGLKIAVFTSLYSWAVPGCTRSCPGTGGLSASFGRMRL